MASSLIPGNCWNGTYHNLGPPGPAARNRVLIKDFLLNGQSAPLGPLFFKARTIIGETGVGEKIAVGLKQEENMF